jgi:hypothetical protein
LIWSVNGLVNGFAQTFYEGPEKIRLMEEAKTQGVIIK